MNKYMKKVTRWLAVLIIAIGSAGTGGYFYFKDAFKAPPNQLTIVPKGEWIAFSWSGGNDAADASQYDALLVPVQLKGRPEKLWMQFDLGAPYTVLYSAKIASLQARNGINVNSAGSIEVRTQDKRNYADNIDLQIGAQPVHANTVRVYKTSEPINWDKPEGTEIIGTLGADFIDGHVLVIDYPKRRLAIWPQLPDALVANTMFSPLKFKERRLLIPATLGDRARDIMFDTGSSAYALLTDQSTWRTLARPGAAPSESSVNSWGKPLKVHTIATDATLDIGTTRFDLREVAYVDGISLMQEWLMRFSGMGGMTGNRLFLARTIVVDTREQRFGLMR
jgi:hypothetical protein